MFCGIRGLPPPKKSKEDLLTPPQGGVKGRSSDILLHPPDELGFAALHCADGDIDFAGDVPVVFFVEATGTEVSDLTLEPNAGVALLSQLLFGGGEDQRGDAATVPCGEDEDLTDAVAVPSGEAHDLVVDGGDDAIGQCRFHARQEKLKRAACGDFGREMRVAVMPTVVPNASERRNVSGARKSYHYVSVGAQRPRTAFAMMLRCTSFEPA